MDGWIKLHRKLLDWQWFKVPEMVQLFIYLLLKANHNQSEWRGVKIERGQLITGLNSLGENTGISFQTLRTCLKRLEKSGEINTQTTNKYTIVTICNYESYQTDNIDTNKQTNKQLTNNQQTTNKQLTTNKNNKKEKNEKKVFVPPTLSEVKAYFKEKGYSEQAAERAWMGYDANNWIDSRKQPIINWKMKMIQVWFEPKNKIQSNYQVVPR